METITEIEELVKEATTNLKQLILYNDPINTFEHVIDCLIKYYKHTSEQAGQCALLVHYKGSCSIKNGSFDELLPYYTALLDSQLKVSIE